MSLLLLGECTLSGNMLGVYKRILLRADAANHGL